MSSRSGRSSTSTPRPVSLHAILVWRAATRRSLPSGSSRASCSLMPTARRSLIIRVGTSVRPARSGLRRTPRQRVSLLSAPPTSQRVLCSGRMAANTMLRANASTFTLASLATRLRRLWRPPRRQIRSTPAPRRSWPTPATCQASLLPPSPRRSATQCRSCGMPGKQ